jgi:hypothetical protein
LKNLVEIEVNREEADLKQESNRYFGVFENSEIYSLLKSGRQNHISLKQAV